MMREEARDQRREGSPRWSTGSYFSPAHRRLRKGQRPENRLRGGPRPRSEVLACLLLTCAEIREIQAMSQDKAVRAGLLSLQVIDQRKTGDRGRHPFKTSHTNCRRGNLL